MKMRVSLLARSCVVWLSLTTGAVANYSWQLPHAAYTTNGDLAWQPLPFTYQAGVFVRYIDYENGNDANNGYTTNTPWKHHPWDPEATLNAAAGNGRYTYVFKRGVVYRGRLIATPPVGSVSQPIRLTSRPDWGTGEAAFHASMVITNWRRGGHPLMPSSNLVWYADLPFAPRRLWLVENNTITRIPLARTPNWTVSNPHDVKSEWWTWTSPTMGRTNIDGVTCFVCADPVHLTQPASYYQDAIVWTEYKVVMATPYPARVRGYDPVTKALCFAGIWGDMHEPWQHNRYFLEDKPQYLDAPGEFWFEKQGEGGRLYLRLPGDRDPNGLHIEAARYFCHIDGTNITNLHISGLTFRFNNAYWDLTQRYTADPNIINAAIRFQGAIDNLSVRNCRFEHVSKAVRIKSPDYRRVIDRIAITDNEIVWTDHGAIDVHSANADTPPFGELGHVDILRNRLYQIGLRPYAADGHGHAIDITFPLSAEIAGNMLDRCYGAGIFVFGGKASDRSRNRPFTRILIHHNRVTDPLLNNNDWGGIETWQGGPFYLYSNISGNPGGYWNPPHVWNINQPASQRSYSTARFGFAYYLDGAFKNYVFNNIAWGLNNNLTSALCNAAAFQSVLSFENIYFNNTVYKFGAGSTRHSVQTGRNMYLGNLWLDLSDWTFYVYNFQDVSDATYDYDRAAFGNNIFYLPARNFGMFEVPRATHSTFAAFQAALTSRQTLVSSLGQLVTSTPVRNPEAHDFQLDAASPAVDYGVKVFVPWSLSATVAEWHFWRNAKDPRVIHDAHWYMRPYYFNRDTYYTTRRWHLLAQNVTSNDFFIGPLEDWCAGALRFNGVNQYAVPDPYGTGDESLVMNTNDFIIEAYFRSVPGHTGGVLLQMLGPDGYALRLSNEGQLELVLRPSHTNACAARSDIYVNDGQWHHVLAEVNRAREQGVTLYVDGLQVSHTFSGTWPAPEERLTNVTRFVVGGGPGLTYFAGDLEFLRVAQDTLAQSRTTIEELYEWQFNGPFLRDFRGRPAHGRRDAGAFEYVPASEEGRPQILLEPLDVTVDEGARAGFTVLADSAGFYQWRKDGTAIPAATNARYVIETAFAADAGVYDVIVGNALGTVTSTAARLVTVPEPAAALAFLALTCACRARRRT